MHALQLEWKKLAPNRIFKIAVAMYLVLLPLMYMAVKAGFGDLEEAGDGGNAAIGMMMSHYEFPRIWDTIAYWASWLTYFLMTYMAGWMVTSEFEFKTARQNIITGMTRNNYLWGKFLMLVVLITGATIYMVGMVALFGALAGGYGEPYGAEVWAIRNFFVQTLFYSSFAFMLSVLFRKSGLAMIVFFAYTLIIERIIYYLVFLQLLESSAVANYLPASIAWFTLPFYLFKMTADGFMEMGSNDNIIFVPEGQAFIATLIYTAICWGISVWVYNRRDL